MTGNIKTVADHWDHVAICKAAGNSPRAWWHNKQVIRYVSKLLTGTEYGSLEVAIQAWIKQNTDASFNHGISMGCGLGSNEISLLNAGIVKDFTLLELSPIRVNKIRERVNKEGLTNRVKIIEGDGMKVKLPANYYDLVYWNNSLHHMFSAKDAVRWSYDRLSDRGLFIMFEYVGPNRFQFTTKALTVLNKIRNDMPAHWFLPGSDRKTCCPPLDYWMKRDPSEAADSEAIMTEIYLRFKCISAWPLGGLIYHVAMQDIWNNINVDAEEHLKKCLGIDATLTREMQTIYIAAIAKKENGV